jgi:hypothetical protein
VGNKFDLGRLAIVSENRRVKQRRNCGLRSQKVYLPLSNAYKLMELDVEGLSDQLGAENKFAA